MPTAETRSRSAVGIRQSTSGITGLPRRWWLTAALLALTIVYAVLQVGFVRPYLPADPQPNLARPPLVAPADTAALASWRGGRPGPPPRPPPPATPGAPPARRQP